MNIGRLLLYLTVGTVAMLIPIMIQGVWYRLKCSKRITAAILLTIAGTLGTFLLFYIENGRFGGTSFYGAIFFVPVLFVPVAHVMKLPYGELMDICAPAECVMLAIMKVQCLTTGCCGGRMIHINDLSFVFPSQIVELISALIIGFALLLISGNKKFRGKVFPLYMVIYGLIRFGLNLFRNVKNMHLLPIPAGNFWSLISLIIGIVWLIVLWKKQAKIIEKANGQ